MGALALLVLGEGFVAAAAFAVEGVKAFPGFAELKYRPPPDPDEKMEYDRLAAAAGGSSFAILDIELGKLMRWLERERVCAGRIGRRRKVVKAGGGKIARLCQTL